MRKLEMVDKDAGTRTLSAYIKEHIIERLQGLNHDYVSCFVRFRINSQFAEPLC